MISECSNSNSSKRVSSSSSSGGCNGANTSRQASGRPHTDLDAHRPPTHEQGGKVAAFFYANGIAFYASRSLEFREMVAAIARQGAAYTAPKYDALRTTLLDTTRQVNNNI